MCLSNYTTMTCKTSLTSELIFPTDLHYFQMNEREQWDSEATPQEVIDFVKQNYYIIKQREANQVNTLIT